MERYWHWKKVISLEMKSTQRMVCLHKSMMNAKLSQQRALGAVYIVRAQPRGSARHSQAHKGPLGLGAARGCKTVAPGLSAFCAFRLDQNRFEICL